MVSRAAPAGRPCGTLPGLHPSMPSDDLMLFRLFWRAGCKQKRCLSLRLKRDRARRLPDQQPRLAPTTDHVGLCKQDGRSRNPSPEKHIILGKVRPGNHLAEVDLDSCRTAVRPSPLPMDLVILHLRAQPLVMCSAVCGQDRDHGASLGRHWLTQQPPGSGTLAKTSSTLIKPGVCAADARAT